uniref:Circumsporozoite protein-like protein n=1 Tax=Oryza sativa subsp. japonica TaxID=39947 RepID=Q69MQ7_ORYSJ|nr:circumsporozoite protein-like protein [Oryza sativa Japonica Group]
MALAAAAAGEELHNLGPAAADSFCAAASRPSWSSTARVGAASSPSRRHPPSGHTESPAAAAARAEAELGEVRRKLNRRRRAVSASYRRKMPARGSAGQRPAVDDDLDAVEHDRLLGYVHQELVIPLRGQVPAVLPRYRLAVASSKNTARMASNIERRIGLSPEWAEAAKSNMCYEKSTRTRWRVFTWTCDSVLEEHWDMPPEQFMKTHASMRLAHSERRKKERPPASAGAGEKDRRAGLLLEELLVSGIRFIFFSNWGGYLYRARFASTDPDVGFSKTFVKPKFYPRSFSDFKFEGDRRYPCRVHDYRGASRPGPSRVVPGGTRLSATRLTVSEVHAGRARVWGGRRGACARFAEDAVRRAHAQPHSSRWTACAREGKRRERLAGSADPVAAEVAPTWRLRGSHAGRREVEEDAGRNGRRTAVASSGANHGDTSEGEHTGMLHRTRGDEPTARIRQGMLDGGGLRRRQPAAREGGNGDGATRDRFGRARASTRLRESVAGVGLGGATPSEAGDERASAGRGGAEAMTTAMTAGRFGAERRHGQ